jgi:MbtH protein
MSATDPEDINLYKVVVNDEEQYSIWRADIEPPPGWNGVGKTGSKAECLAYIKEVWVDTRPLSLRNRMQGIGCISDEFITPAR